MESAELLRDILRSNKTDHPLICLEFIWANRMALLSVLLMGWASTPALLNIDRAVSWG
jgi:hypothetical protein